MIDSTVRSAYRAGLCLLPVVGDGSKRPDVGGWREFQRRRPTPEQMRAFRFDGREGFGMVAGAVSGLAECWDFDCADTFDAFVAMANDVGLGDLVHRIRQGYEDRTPGGGRRWIVRFDADVAWKDCTLARRPGREGEPKVKTLIELPTFAILAPSNGSTHPTGRPYVRVSGAFDQIASYTADERDALMSLARSFDRMPKVEAKPTRVESPTPGKRPGDDFNRRTDWPEILEPHGWTPVFTRDDATYWRRPGKAHGVSASTNRQGSGLLWVFTSSTQFEAERSYSRFAAYTVLAHGGDYGAAAATLAAQGYGVPVQKTGRPARAGGLAPDVAADLKWRYLKDVQRERVDWLWRSRLARGTLTLWIGDGGLGKSRASNDLAARITTGALWPDGDAAPLGNVIILSAEDAASFTIRPAVETAGGDLSRVAILDAVVEANGRERLLQLATDLPKLEGLIDEVKPQLVIIDPLSAYFGTALDSYRDTDVRSVLAPLVKLAETRQIAVLGIMHVGKSTDRQARHRVLGSVAFTNAARLVFAVGPDPEDPDRRFLVPVKTNLCREAPTLAFQLEDADGVAVVAWEPVPVENVTADAVLAGKPAISDEDQQDAVSVIRSLLDDEDWPLDAKAAIEAGRAHGIHERTMRRTARKLGIDVRKFGFRGGWRWHRPKSDSKPFVATSGKHEGSPAEQGNDSGDEGDEPASVSEMTASSPSRVPKRTLSASTASAQCLEIDRNGEGDTGTDRRRMRAVVDAEPPGALASTSPLIPDRRCAVCGHQDCLDQVHAEATTDLQVLDEHLGPLENVTFEWPEPSQDRLPLAQDRAVPASWAQSATGTARAPRG